MRTKHLWLSVVTGAAVGAASYYLKKKLSSASAAAPGAAAVPSPAPAAAAKEAVYSFISGFKNAATVEFRAVYGGLSGVKFRDVDNFCLAFPVPEDPHSYLLMTLVKAPDNDDELETIPEAPDFRGLLNSASFRRV